MRNRFVQIVLVLILLVINTSSDSYAQGDGVHFFNGTFKEAKEKAKTENKFLIVDCHTSWCGPCKAIAAEVFPQKECGDFFNPDFVFLKMDMEKGEGVELRKIFQIRAYPTFIIFNSQGEEQHRIIGGGDIERFIARVKVGIDSVQSELAISKRYNDGNCDVEVVKSYLNTLFEAGKEELATSIYKKYYNSLSNEKRQSPENWWVFNLKEFSNFGGEQFNYLTYNKKILIASVGKEQYNTTINKLLRKELEQYVSGVSVRKYGSEEAADVAFKTLKDYITSNRFTCEEFDILATLAQSLWKTDNDTFRKQNCLLFKKMSDKYLEQMCKHLISNNYSIDKMGVAVEICRSALPRIKSKTAVKELNDMITNKEMLVNLYKTK